MTELRRTGREQPDSFVGVPLSALLAQTLIGYTRDYGGNEGVPPLPLWSNLLRFIDDDGVRLGDAPRCARISRRAMSPIITHGERAGLLVVDRSGGRGRATARLTERGSSARQNGWTALRRTEGAWQERFGELARLRDGLEALVGQLDLELPHFPMGYGAVDNRVTGGRHVAGDAGPPAIPAHGQDWQPVVRDGPGTAAGLPPSALLSQAVVAFAIDYESEGGLSLPSAAVLQAIGEDGLPVASLPPLWVRSAHGIVTIDAGTRSRGKVVRLTPRGEALRDDYVRLTTEIERRWRQRFGSDLIRSIRSASEVITPTLDAGPPHHPIVSFIAGSL